MTRDEMRARGNAKITQVKELMKVLQIHVEPRRMLDRNNFLIDTVLFIDTEDYQLDPEPAATTGASVPGTGIAPPAPKEDETL